MPCDRRLGGRTCPDRERTVTSEGGKDIRHNGHSDRAWGRRREGGAFRLPRLAIGLLCGIILLFAPAQAAVATPPVHFSVEEPFTVVYEPCGLVEEGVFHRSFTTFFDKDGKETHTLEQVSFDAVITNPATGETFRDRGHNTVRFEPGFATGFTLSGIVFAVHTPSEGVRLLSVGRLIADSNFDTVFQSAQMLGFPEMQAAVCASLG
jgi:hypothetical protein